MFLKKLKINGFKSFARPIKIEFNSPLTAIVGPNGSGKSNIVDAIRWVLGEQSAKMLRGKTMADIIFSGSKNHKPLQKASVYLYLDNSDHTLEVESNEVIIGRRVTKDGESDYLLNGNVCRLKDIKKLLLGTGLGKDLYSIVGQGKIDSIINSKPAKLRELFEEAAGISRHKMRKEEAEKRLQKTSQNLQRINDLINELKKQLRPLKKEAEKAKKHEKIKAKLKKMEINLFMDKWEENKVEFSSVKMNKKFLQEKLEYNQEELQKLKDNIEENNKIIEKKKKLMARKKEKLFNLRSRKDELKNKVTLYKERKNNIIDNIDSINNWKENIITKKDEIKVNINELKDKRKKSENKKETLQKKIKSEKAQLKKYRENVEDLKEELNNYQDELIIGKENIKDIKYEMERVKEKINYIQENKQNLENEQKMISKKINMRKKNREKVKTELRSLVKKRETIEKENNNLPETRQKKIDLCEKKEDELERLNNKLQDKISRLNILREMDDSYNGYYYGVKNVLQANDKFEGIKGIVANLINVKKDYVQAVETALGAKMQNLVVDNDHTAGNIIKHLKRNKLGYATFLPVNLINGKKIILDNNIKDIEGYSGIASNFVEHKNYLQGIVDYLLGNIIITRDIDSAAEITKKINSRYKIVTLAGEIIRTGGAMSGGSKKTAKKSLISRSQEKKKLAAVIEKLKNEVNRKRHKISKIKIEIEKLEDNMNQNREMIHRLELDESSVQADLKGLNSDIYKLEKTKENNDNKIKIDNKELGKLNNRREKLISKIDESDNNSKEQEIINKLKKRINKLEENINTVNKKITDVKVKIATEKQKLESFKTERKKMKEKINSYNNKFKDKNKKIKNKKEELENIESKLDDVKSELLNYRQRIKNTDNDIPAMKQKIEKKDKKLDELINQKQNKEQEIEKIKDQIHKIELKLNRLENKRHNIKQKLEEDYQLNPEKDNPDNRIKITDYKNVKNKINEFKKTIKAMGMVNRGAEREYNKLKKRVDYLISQKQDLLQAKESINKVIAEIEDTMGNLFYKSYTNVKEKFENIFNELFSGGKAQLSLTEPDKLLTTGVEISAQPPGKKLKKLSLMSGGERALTAIALVFAFLNVSPSPFYILDEIDAPLDDANVDRFGRFISKYAKFAQFVIITHRKHMMTRADTIYGVTMQEMGISRLVSLNMNSQGGKIYEYI